MKDFKLICPECKSDLIVDISKLHCSNNHVYIYNNGIYNFLPQSINEVITKDASYHEDQMKTWIEQNQIDTLRNLFFHRKILEFISMKSTEKSNILEIGGGVGFDLEMILKSNISFRKYVFSDISEPMLSYVSKKLDSNLVKYCAIDGHNIPFEKNQFDIVCMIATVHHFHDINTALKEIIRVTKPDGFIILGIEPNRSWLQLISKIKRHLIKILPEKKSSPADEEAEGFFIKDFKTIEKAYSLKLIQFEPIWFFCGFVHYGLEFVYRAFRLRNRIRLPFFIEKIFINIDNLLLHVPFISNLYWHYTVIYQKGAR